MARKQRHSERVRAQQQQQHGRERERREREGAGSVHHERGAKSAAQWCEALTDTSRTRLKVSVVAAKNERERE